MVQTFILEQQVQIHDNIDRISVSFVTLEWLELLKWVIYHFIVKIGLLLILGFEHRMCAHNNISVIIV